MTTTTTTAAANNSSKKRKNAVVEMKEERKKAEEEEKKQRVAEKLVIVDERLKKATEAYDAAKAKMDGFHEQKQNDTDLYNYRPVKEALQNIIKKNLDRSKLRNGESNDGVIAVMLKKNIEDLNNLFWERFNKNDDIEMELREDFAKASLELKHAKYVCLEFSRSNY